MEEFKLKEESVLSGLRDREWIVADDGRYHVKRSYDGISTRMVVIKKAAFAELETVCTREVCQSISPILSSGMKFDLTKAWLDWAFDERWLDADLEATQKLMTQFSEEQLDVLSDAA